MQRCWRCRRCRSEVVKKCGGAELYQRCRGGAEAYKCGVQRCRGAEVEDVQRSRGGAVVQMSIYAEVQRCRCRCMCRGLEV